MSTVYTITIPRDPLIVVLGYTAYPVIDEHNKVAIGWLSYICRKLVALHFIANVSQSCVEYVKKVNSILRIEIRLTP